MQKLDVYLFTNHKSMGNRIQVFKNGEQKIAEKEFDSKSIAIDARSLLVLVLEKGCHFQTMNHEDIKGDGSAQKITLGK